jgi:hypothetical protein
MTNDRAFGLTHAKRRFPWPALTLCLLAPVVAEVSRLLTVASLPRNTGVERNMGATRSFESALASSMRGSTTSAGPGSTSAMKPRKLSRHSVLSICAAESSTTILLGWLGLNTSIGSR